MDPPDTEGRPESRPRAGRPPVPGIVEAQRRRLCDAVCAVFAERGGYGGATVAALVDSAGISTKTFYELFEGKDDCVLAAHRACAARLGAALADAWDLPGAWPERLRASIAAALSYGEAEPAALRFLLLDAPTAGRLLLSERRRAVAPVLQALRQGRAHAAAHEPPPLAEEMLLAGLAWRIGTALQEGESLASLAPAVAEFTLAWYPGSDHL